MARLNVTSEEYALNFRFFFKAVSDSRGSLTKAFHNGHFDSQSECLLKVMNLVGAVILLSWKIKVMVGWFCIIDCVMISVTVKSCSGGPVWSVHLWWGFLHSLAVRTAPPPCRTCNEPQGSGRLGGGGAGRSEDFKPTSENLQNLWGGRTWEGSESGGPQADPRCPDNLAFEGIWKWQTKTAPPSKTLTLPVPGNPCPSPGGFLSTWNSNTVCFSFSPPLDLIRGWEPLHTSGTSGKQLMLNSTPSQFDCWCPLPPNQQSQDLPTRAPRSAFYLQIFLVDQHHGTSSEEGTETGDPTLSPSHQCHMGYFMDWDE